MDFMNQVATGRGCRVFEFKKHGFSTASDTIYLLHPEDQRFTRDLYLFAGWPLACFTHINVKL